MNERTLPSLAIVGAGLSGLALAWRVREAAGDRPVSITVFEAAPRVGGSVRSEELSGFCIEHGPNGFLGNKPTTLQLVKDVGLGEAIIDASESAANRYILVGKELIPLPTSPTSFLTSRVMPLIGRLRALLEPLARRPSKFDGDESLHKFASRRLGYWTARRLFDPLAAGVYGGDSRRLSARAAFPQITDLEADHGSLFGGMRAAARQSKGLDAAGKQQQRRQRGLHSLKGGMGQLIDALSAGPDQIHVNSPVKGLHYGGDSWVLQLPEFAQQRFDAVAVALPSAAAAPLVERLDDKLAKVLRDMPQAPINVVALGFHESAIGRPLDGFGYLVPSEVGSPVLGCLWSSSVWPGRRAPREHVTLRVMLGGRHHPECADWNEERLLSTALDHITPILRVTGRPMVQRVVRWNEGIPQYEIGHAAKVFTARKLAARFPGLWLCGNSFDGVSMNDCCASAARLAPQIVDFLGTRARGPDPGAREEE